MSFICKIPNIDEINKRWDYLTKDRTVDKENWNIWRKQAIYNYSVGNYIMYYGFLDDEIICEATAIVKANQDKYVNDLINEKTVYLSAFRTNKEYEGQGYFSKLYKFMLSDLKEKGYEYATLGVEPTEEKNKSIYNHYGFTEFIKETHETYPNGEEVTVDYYKKRL